MFSHAKKMTIYGYVCLFVCLWLLNTEIKHHFTDALKKGK